MYHLSEAQFGGEIFGLAFGVLCAILVYVFLYRKSKTMETGMIGAVGYGVAGFLWGGYLLPVVVIAIIGNMTVLLTVKQNVYFVYLLIVAIINAIFLMLLHIWGLFLTNQKQNSYYRSAAVGLGYAVGNILLQKGMQLNYATKIYRGIQPTKEQVATYKSVVSTPTSSLFCGGIADGMSVFFFALVAVALGKLMMEKKTKMAVLYGIAVFGVFNLLRNTVNLVCPTYIYPYVYMVLMLVIGGASAYVLYQRLLQGDTPVKAPTKGK